MRSSWHRAPIPAIGREWDGAIAYARGYGSANLEHRIALTPQSMLDIGSMGKQFTAAVVTLLAQEGRLSLDDDIREYIPELPDYGHPITLRQLLHHTGGLRNYNRLLEVNGHQADDVTTDEDALTVLARQKAPNFRPGSEFVYDGHRAVGHGGSSGGYKSQPTRYPGRRLSLAELCNRSDAAPESLVRRVTDIFLPDSSAAAPGRLPALPEVRLPQNVLPLLAGTFLGDAPDENDGRPGKAVPAGRRRAL